MSRIVIRELKRPDEFASAQEVAFAAWGFEDRQLPSTFDLSVAGHVGGLTAGAFDGAEMAGFVHGLPRTNVNEACHHSHMLAVRPPWRGRGLAARLKLFQRRWCLKRGIRLVTWTYDPTRIVNARLNLVRLRARATRYLPNLYGPLGGIYGGLPTDRFEVEWRLDAREVERAARGIVPEEKDGDTLPRATLARIPRAPRLALEVPLDTPATGGSERAVSQQARARLCRVAARLFAAGYEARAIQLFGGRALYIFERG